MKKFIRGLIFLVGSIMLTGYSVSAAETGKVAEGSYLQESMVRVVLPSAGAAEIVKFARVGNGIVAVSPDRIFRFESGKWRVEEYPGPWKTACIDLSGKLWVGGTGVVAQPEGRIKLNLPEEALMDTVRYLLWQDASTLLVGTSRGAWERKETWRRLPEFKALSVNQLARGNGDELWAATSGGLFRKIDGKWVNLSYAVMAPGLGMNFWSLSKGMTSGEVYFGAQPALGMISDKGDHQLFSSDNGLPFGPVTSIVPAGGDLWLGTPCGAIRKSGDAWSYFAGKRWLDNNRVNDILVLDSNRVWVASPAGINELRRLPMTLEQKASYFEKRLNERHLHHGFAAACRFKSPNDTTVFSHSTDDNDGLWTSIYLAAESFRYAVTKDKDAFDNAVRTFLAMEKLNTVNPIPGYMARSYVSIEESTGQGGEWHVSADGKWKWKGDTSSDEIVGHMFAYPIFFDLVAEGAMKERVKSLVERLMTHIVDHNFEMVDLDGLATRWAVWNPDSLNYSPRWMYERGINSLQILAFLKSATHVTQNPKYEKAYNKLTREHHYLDNMLVQKMYGPYEINHSDDELSFLPYYTLVKYGTGTPDVSVYTRSLERSWKAEEADRIPIWNYIASIGLGKDCGLAVAEEEMQQIPMDLRNWRMENSHRWDIRKSSINDRFFKPQAILPIPTPERAVSKWNSNTYVMDGGGDGLGEDDGAYFLLPYWMARYYRILK